MRFHNLDDLTVFGAGSEWFWTMLTMVALTITFLAIARQLRAQRAAVAFDQFQQLDQEWLSPRMRHVRLRLAIGLRTGAADDQNEQFAGRLDNFFRKLELLHRKGYLDTELLWLNFGEDVVRWWSVVSDLVQQVRQAYDSPNEFAEWERLMRRMRDMMAKRGVPAFQTDPESIRARLDWIIDVERTGLRFGQEVEAGTIPPAPVAPLPAEDLLP